MVKRVFDWIDDACFFITPKGIIRNRYSSHYIKWVQYTTHLQQGTSHLGPCLIGGESTFHLMLSIIFSIK